MAPLKHRVESWPAALLAAALGCTTAGGGAPASRAPASSAEAPTAAAAGVDLAPVDGAVDPCIDFARFACNSDRNGGDRPLRANDAVAWRRPAIERFMVEIAAGQHADPGHGTPLLREFYLRCTDPGARAGGVGELRAALDDLARAATLAELAGKLGHLRSAGTRLLIDFTPERPLEPPAGVVAARIGLAAPRLPRRFYTPAHELVGAYRRHWDELARLSGVVTPAEVEAAARIDAWLAGSGPPVSARDRTAPRGVATTIELTQLTQTRFPWPAYLSGLEPAISGPFSSHAAPVLARVDALASLPLPELKSYARVMLMEQWAEFLDGAFLEEELRFHEGVVRGLAARRAKAAPPPQPIAGGSEPFEGSALDIGAANLPAACASLAARDLSRLLADAYLSELPDRASERIARRMFDRLRTRLDRRVRRADWIDVAAREPARRRLGEVGLVFVEDVAAPHGASGEAAPPPGSFLELYRRTRQSDARKTLALIGRPWTDEPLTPTLSPGEYFSRPNLVWVSPEIVRPPYLRAGEFNATSFGALGAVMGHEIAHAIPAGLQGAQSEGASAGGADGTGTGGAGAAADGTGKPAATSTASVALSARLGCLKRHLDRVSSPEAAVDSRRRLGESWADRVGVDLALEVMQDDAITAGKARTLAAWQRDFFVAYAQTLCAFQNDGAPEVDLLRDPHAPASSRINSVVADSPEFARAFSCAAGTPMAPPSRCSAW